MPKETKKIRNIDDCWFEWQFADGTVCRDVYAAHKEQKDVYAVVLAGKGAVVYREHRRCCHIDDAYRILAGGRFGKWKTTKLLVTLRQALRERFAQGMPLEIPRDGIGRVALNEFLRMARSFDTVHHGQRTF